MRETDRLMRGNGRKEAQNEQRKHHLPPRGWGCNHAIQQRKEHNHSQCKIEAMENAGVDADLSGGRRSSDKISSRGEGRWGLTILDVEVRALATLLSKDNLDLEALNHFAIEPMLAILSILIIVELNKADSTGLSGCEVEMRQMTKQKTFKGWNGWDRFAGGSHLV